MSKSEILQGIAYVSIMALCLNGCVHSCKKHKDDKEWFQWSPLVAYRGAEYFWHDDFAGVDWDKRIKDDGATAIELLMKSNSETTVDLREQADYFSDKISKYPRDKFEKIKIAGQSIFRINTLVKRDVGDFIENYQEGDRFKLSKGTKNLLDSLGSYYDVKGSSDMSNKLEETFNAYNFNDSLLTEMRKNYNEGNLFEEATVKSYYKRIFKEDYND